MKTATVDITITLPDSNSILSLNDIHVPDNSDGSTLKDILSRVILEYSISNQNQNIEKILSAANDDRLSLYTCSKEFNIEDIEFCAERKFIEQYVNGSFKITFQGLMWLAQFGLSSI